MKFSRILTTYPEGYDSTETFCQAAIFVVHLSAAVSVFCIVCKLKTPNLTVFCNIIISLNSTIKNVVISWMRPNETYYITLYRYGYPTIMWLCCKQFSRYLYSTNYTKFWQMLKKPTNYNWCACANEKIPNKSMLCLVEYFESNNYSAHAVFF